MLNLILAPALFIGIVAFPDGEVKKYTKPMSNGLECVMYADSFKEYFVNSNVQTVAKCIPIKGIEREA